MRFEWDENKADRNRRKHGIGFELATRVFEDEDALYEQDRIVDGELRWRVIGSVAGAFVLCVAHTVTYGDKETTRIISARKATPRERWQYSAGSL